MLNISDNFTIGYANKVIAKVDKSLTLSSSSNTPNITVLSGSNGSGKTTFIRTLSQLIPSLEGSVTWNEEPLSLLHQKKGIVYLPETLDFCSYLTPKQILNALAVDTQKAFELAELFQVPLKLFFENLSKGQKQKIRLILSLERITHPGLYLLDEPFSGLDIETREVGMSLLKESFSKKDRRLLIALHTERFPENWLQNSLIIKEGKISLGGIGQDVYQLRQMDHAQ